AVDEVGDAVTAAQQFGLLGWVELFLGEARQMQRWPEAVARSGEVVAGGGGIQARVDADEQHLQPRRDDVADALVGGRGEFCGARPAGGCSRLPSRPAQA